MRQRMIRRVGRFQYLETVECRNGHGSFYGQVVEVALFGPNFAPAAYGIRTAAGQVVVVEDERIHDTMFAPVMAAFGLAAA